MFASLKCSALALFVGIAAAGSAAAECGVIVFFNSGQDGIGTGAAATLAEYIAKNPNVQLAVTGYSDAAGNAEANQRLSQRRAQAVAEVLQTDIGASVVSVTGAGEAARPDTTGPEDPRNRRVEVVDTSCEGGLFAAAPVTGPVAGSEGLAVAAGVGALGIIAAASGGDDGGSDGTAGTD